MFLAKSCKKYNLSPSSKTYFINSLNFRIYNRGIKSLISSTTGLLQKLPYVIPTIDPTYRFCFAVLNKFNNGSVGARLLVR